MNRWSYLTTTLLILWTAAALAGLSDGLVAHYPLDGDVNDVSGNGNHGAANGEIALTIDRFNKANGAYSFDGVNDYLRLPNTVSRDFTVAFWLKTVKQAPTGTHWFEGWGLIDAEGCGIVNDWGLALIDGGKVSFGIGNPDTTIKSTAMVNDSNWHFILGTRTQSTGTFQLYIDGVLQATEKGNSNTLQAAPWIGIGNNSCSVSANRNWLNGTIDHIRIYNRILTDTETQQLYTGVTSGNIADNYNKGKQDGIAQGILQCKTDPTSCGIGGYATYNPETGELYIPFVDVPGAFANTPSYEIYLLRTSNNYIFELDLTRIRQR
jgi:hypothetical protein